MKKFLTVAVILLVFACATFPAMAEENEKVQVLQKKAYIQAGKHELTPWFSVSVADKYTSEIGGGLQYQYHILESLGVQAEGFYFSSGETSLTSQLRDLNKEPIEPQLMQMVGYAGANILWYPLYGKLSLISEVALSYNIYIQGGAGVMFSRVYDASVDKYSEPSPQFAGTFGVGASLFILKWLDLKIEIRDIIFNASGAGTNSGGDVNSAIRNNVMFNVGVGFLL